MSQKRNKKKQIKVHNFNQKHTKKQQKSYSKYVHKYFSLYAAISIMTSKKATMAKMEKTTMIVNMSKKEGSTIFATVSVFAFFLLHCTN